MLGHAVLCYAVHAVFGIRPEEMYAPTYRFYLECLVMLRYVMLCMLCSTLDLEGCMLLHIFSVILLHITVILNIRSS